MGCVRASSLAATLLLAACQQILGLHDLPPDAPAPDAGPTMVTGRLLLEYATNAADFSPMVVAAPYTAAFPVTITYIDDRGATTDVPYSLADGTFAFQLAAPGPYRLRVTTWLRAFELQLAATHLELVDAVAGRPDRVPTTMSTPVHFSFGSTVGLSMVYTTGLWTQTVGPGSNSTFDLDWHNAASLSGPVGLLDANRDDALYVAVLTTQGPGPMVYDAITSFGGPYAVTLTDGQPTTLSGALATVAPNRCAHVVASAGLEAQRFAATQSRSATSTVAEWLVMKTPALQLGSVGSEWIASGSQAAPIADVDMTASFFDPFLGDTLVTLGVIQQFNVVAPGGSAVTLGVGTIEYIRAPDLMQATCSSNNAVLRPDVGIPGEPTLAGTPLASDGASIAIDRSRLVPLAWTLAASGPVDETTVLLHELTARGTATADSIVAEIGVVGTTVQIDPALFVTGHTYAIELIAETGFPGAANGDLATVAYPHQQSITWSHTFVVGN